MGLFSRKKKNLPSSTTPPIQSDASLLETLSLSLEPKPKKRFLITRLCIFVFKRCHCKCGRKTPEEKERLNLAKEKIEQDAYDSKERRREMDEMGSEEKLTWDVLELPERNYKRMVALNKRVTERDDERLRIRRIEEEDNKEDGVTYHHLQLKEFKRVKPSVALHKTFVGHRSVVNSFKVTSDSKYIVSSSSDLTLKLWDVHTAKCLKTYEGHTKDIRDCDICPDFSYGLTSSTRSLLSCSSDKTLRIWDARLPSSKLVLHGHTDVVYACSFSPCGAKIISSSEDQTLRLWSAMHGYIIYVYKAHTSAVVTCGFSTSGRYIVSASDYGEREIKMWHAGMPVIRRPVDVGHCVFFTSTGLIKRVVLTEDVDGDHFYDEPDSEEEDERCDAMSDEEEEEVVHVVTKDKTHYAKEEDVLEGTTGGRVDSKLIEGIKKESRGSSVDDDLLTLEQLQLGKRKRNITEIDGYTIAVFYEGKLNKHNAATTYYPGQELIVDVKGVKEFTSFFLSACISDKQYDMYDTRSGERTGKFEFEREAVDVDVELCGGECKLSCGGAAVTSSSLNSKGEHTAKAYQSLRFKWIAAGDVGFGDVCFKVALTSNNDNDNDNNDNDTNLNSNNEKTQQTKSYSLCYYLKETTPPRTRDASNNTFSSSQSTNASNLGYKPKPKLSFDPEFNHNHIIKLFRSREYELLEHFFITKCKLKLPSTTSIDANGKLTSKVATIIGAREVVAALASSVLSQRTVVRNVRVMNVSGKARIIETRVVSVRDELPGAEVDCGVVGRGLGRDFYPNDSGDDSGDDSDDDKIEIEEVEYDTDENTEINERGDITRTPEQTKQHKQTIKADKAAREGLRFEFTKIAKREVEGMVKNWKLGVACMDEVRTIRMPLKSKSKSTSKSKSSTVQQQDTNTAPNVNVNEDDEMINKYNKTYGGTTPRLQMTLPVNYPINAKPYGSAVRKGNGKSPSSSKSKSKEESKSDDKDESTTSSTTSSTSTSSYTSIANGNSNLLSTKEGRTKLIEEMVKSMFKEKLKHDKDRLNRRNARGVIPAFESVDFARRSNVIASSNNIRKNNNKMNVDGDVIVEDGKFDGKDESSVLIEGMRRERLEIDKLTLDSAGVDGDGNGNVTGNGNGDGDGKIKRVSFNDGNVSVDGAGNVKKIDEEKGGDKVKVSSNSAAIKVKVDSTKKVKQSWFKSKTKKTNNGADSSSSNLNLNEIVLANTNPQDGSNEGVVSLDTIDIGAIIADTIEPDPTNNAPPLPHPLPPPLPRIQTPLPPRKNHANVLPGFEKAPKSQPHMYAKYDLDLLLAEQNNGLIRTFSSSSSCGHSSSINSVVFSHDDRRVASCSSDTTIKLWDPFSGTLVMTITSNTDIITSISFSYTNTSLVSSSLDNSITVWNLTNGLMTMKLHGHYDAVSNCAFTNFDNQVISCSCDMTVKIWNITPRAPDAPLKPTISNINTTECTVSWIPPSGYNEKILAYFIETRIGLHGDYTDTLSVSGTSTKRTLNNLKTGTAYQVRVRAENAMGKSVWSEACVQFITDFGTPEQLERCEVADVGCSEIMIAWWAPIPTVKGSAIHEFRIQVSGFGVDFGKGGEWGVSWVDCKRNMRVYEEMIELRDGTEKDGKGNGKRKNEEGKGDSLKGRVNEMMKVFKIQRTKEALEVAEGEIDKLLKVARDEVDVLKLKLKDGDVRDDDDKSASDGKSDGKSRKVPGASSEKVRKKNYIELATERKKQYVVREIERTRQALVEYKVLGSHRSHLKTSKKAGRKKQRLLEQKYTPSTALQELQAADKRKHKKLYTRMCFTATGLTPGIMYRLRVASINSTGLGPYSPSSFSTFTSSSPPSLCPPPYISAVGLDFMEVMWKRPHDNGSAVIGYRVKQVWNGIVHEVKRSVQTLRIDGLTPGKAYTFQVCAGNAEGWSGYSEVSCDLITIVKEPDQPSRPLMVEVGPDFVVIKVKAPFDNGSRIERYVVKKREVEDFKQSTWFTCNDSLASAVERVIDEPLVEGSDIITNQTFAFITVRDLKTKTMYDFNVQAFNTAGGSLLSIASYRVKTEAPSVPGEIDMPTLTNVGPNSMVVNWVEPLVLSGANILGYRLQEYCRSNFDGIEDDDDESCDTYTCTTICRKRCEALEAVYSYRYRVCAFNVVGNGGWSEFSRRVEGVDVDEERAGFDEEEFKREEKRRVRKEAEAESLASSQTESESFEGSGGGGGRVWSCLLRVGWSCEGVNFVKIE